MGRVYLLARSDIEIDEQLNLAADQVDEGRSKYKGMIYEDGVRDAINWLIGNQDDVPIPTD